MSSYKINGGKSLYGEVKISAAKNSALTLMCACVLTDGKIFIKDCPDIGDVKVLSEVLTFIGAKIKRQNNGLEIDGRDIFTPELPKSTASEIRASFFLTGALLNRFGYAIVPKPGGCKLGARPVDIHLDGLKRLGAKVFETDEYIMVSAEKLVGSVIPLRYPSVGATENLVLAAVCARGETVIKNAAKEPEVRDLCDFLNVCGAKIRGGGFEEIIVEGVEKLNGGICYRPVPDRIEAGTFLLLSYLLGGKMEISGLKSENISSLTKKILYNTCKNDKLYVNIYSVKLYIQSQGNNEGFGAVKTGPYPSFPTDLQPVVSCAAAGLKGLTVVNETVFDSRFQYLKELEKTGARFKIEGNKVSVEGGLLYGADMTAPDLRGGAGLLVAALKAEGFSVVKNAEAIMRGYEDFDKKLAALGADIRLSHD